MVPLRGRGIGTGPDDDGYGDGDGGGDRAAMGDIPRSVSVQSMTDALNDDDDRDNDRDDDDERRRSRGSGSSFAPDAVGWTPEDENGVGWDKSTASEFRIRSVRWKMRYLTGTAAVSELEEQIESRSSFMSFVECSSFMLSVRSFSETTKV